MVMIREETPFDLSLGLEGTHVVVTGGTGLIGRVVVHAFLKAECNVTIMDILDKPRPFDFISPQLRYQDVDITKADQMDEAFARAEADFGPVETCVALASLDLSVLNEHESLADMDPRAWQRVFDVNISGTFMTCQRWLRSVREAASYPEQRSKLRNVSLVIMGSEAGRYGVRTNAAYAAGKSAVQVGLLKSLAQDAPRIYPKARVNAVAPGAVDTERFKEEVRSLGREWQWRESEANVPLAKPIPPEHVARTILFLASERYSGSVHGQLIPVDGGKTGSLVWTMDELQERNGSDDQ